ncbi:MAG: hypothetical protein IKJ99_03365 [Oscillospiraceae bacterium]|nr:hypothetical protein [Oscillospiraceae bacterium]
MIDLRKYEKLIREQVAKVNKDDPNWKWSIKYIGKTKVHIRWSYLDYLESNNNCFFLVMENEPKGTGIGDWLWARSPNGGIIECYLVVEGKPNPNIGAEQTIQSGIKCAISEIAYTAHNRY